MIATTEHKQYQKLLKKGKGSILKAIRIDKGAGKGLIAGGSVFLVFGLIVAPAGLGIGVVVASPGILMTVIGIILKRKRETSWLEYYQKETGYTEVELEQLDRELAAPTVSLVTCKTPGATVENFVFCFVTENYMVINGVNPYVRRLEDIIAVAYSDSTDNWCLVNISRQDEDTMAVNLFTDTERKEALCMDVIQQLYRKNPRILCGQEIVCEGKRYILERDGAELLRLYREGRTLELAS